TLWFVMPLLGISSAVLFVRYTGRSVKSAWATVPLSQSARMSRYGSTTTYAHVPPWGDGFVPNRTFDRVDDLAGLDVAHAG
ncbi:MAG TPA: hypothetical protein PKA87_08420, partial [Microthrixaceae bacterium]|nr:hypothetical protein [Microthrixaceae bacterium]